MFALNKLAYYVSLSTKLIKNEGKMGENEKHNPYFRIMLFGKD
jgi:hypothetical protein